MDDYNVRQQNVFCKAEGEPKGISFGNVNLENGKTKDKMNDRVLTKRKSTFQIDPHSSSTYDKQKGGNGWESYGTLRTLRRKILIDLERHFGRKVEHDRLFSCLGIYTKY